MTRPRRFARDGGAARVSPRGRVVHLRHDASCHFIPLPFAMQIETPRPETARGGVPRGRQRLGGAFIALLSGGFVAWTWYTALTRGYFYEKAAMIFPAFLVIGLALVAIPGYREERIARGEDVSRLSGSKLITARWWTVLALALAAGAINAFLLHGVL